jgi:uncharacterized lipoprotein YddW (UPF0748 family)
MRQTMKSTAVLVSGLVFFACPELGDPDGFCVETSTCRPGQQCIASRCQSTSSEPVEALDASGDGGDWGVDGGEDAGLPLDGSTSVTFDAGAWVSVAHQRELRGVWVSTVNNLDIPGNLSPDAGVAFVHALVDRARNMGLNALFFQVRPESDAWYRSALEPWSRFLTGTAGRDPGWDPLETLLTSAHARGLEVHAWVNPYRALVSTNAPAHPTHISRTLPEEAVAYDGKVTMNPASEAVRSHVVAVIRDLLDHYDVDGLHFDDYFYPYPNAAAGSFPDETSYQAYRADGGTFGKSDWRRENVNALVRDVMRAVQAEHPQVRFGVSPFGIYRPNTPPGVVGLDAYEAIACDSVKWMKEGWVDYLAPQLYWPTTSTGQPFVPLATWWASTTLEGRHIFVGHGVYRLGSAGWMSVDEIRQQVDTTRALRNAGVGGSIHFRDGNLRSNLLGVADLFRNDLYSSRALPPVLPRLGASLTPIPPVVSAQAASVTVSHALPMTVRFFGAYRLNANGTWTLLDVAGGPVAVMSLGPGTWAVTAVNRGGAESQGTVVVLSPTPP